MIFQTSIPYDVFTAPGLPGIKPLGEDAWFLVDEAYEAQMAYRASLIAKSRDAVIATKDPDPAVLEEMLDEILRHLPNGFSRTENTVHCPDGRDVQIDPEDPFGTLGHVLQDDICLMEKRGDEHVLTGAVLCFPASWRLSEKIGRPLTHIHKPVPQYDVNIARRVQRLFDGVRPGGAIWRFNALWYEDPDLFQPRSVTTPRELTDVESAPYLRSERQVIWRLPKSDAALFTIHTFVLHRADA